MREHAIDQRQRAESVHDGGRSVVGGGEEIDVADGVAHAAQGPGTGGSADLREAGQLVHEVLGDGQGDAERDAATFFPHGSNRAGEVAFADLAPAVQLP